MGGPASDSASMLHPGMLLDGIEDGDLFIDNTFSEDLLANFGMPLSPVAPSLIPDRSPTESSRPSTESPAEYQQDNSTTASTSRITGERRPFGTNKQKRSLSKAERAINEVLKLYSFGISLGILERDDGVRNYLRQMRTTFLDLSQSQSAACA